MLTKLILLAAGLVAVVTIARIASTPAAIAALGVLLIALLAVLAVLTGNPDDLVKVLGAITDLLRGRPGP